MFKKMLRRRPVIFEVAVLWQYKLYLDIMEIVSAKVVFANDVIFVYDGILGNFHRE